MKGVIFDFNGTLFWDSYLHNMAWDNFLKKHSITLSSKEMDILIHGRLNKEILSDLFGNNLTHDNVRQYTYEKESEYRRMCTELGYSDLAEGAVELFEKLKENGIPFVIATASDIENVEFYITTLNLSKWFRREDIIYNDGSVRGKPFPDIFIKALNTLGIEGKDAIIFEDSLAGIRAAEAANAGKIIIVNSTGKDYLQYRDKYRIIKDFKEIVMEWFI